jgi:hypothetical protein
MQPRASSGARERPGVDRLDCRRWEALGPADWEAWQSIVEATPELQSPFFSAAFARIVGRSSDDVWVARRWARGEIDPLTVLAGFERLLAVRPAASLTMVFGSADLLPEVERAVLLRPGLSGHVHLRGRLSQPELVGLYAAADLFVLGSHHEGSGFALLEALSFGVTPGCQRHPCFPAHPGWGPGGGLVPGGRRRRGGDRDGGLVIPVHGGVGDLDLILRDRACNRWPSGDPRRCPPRAAARHR